MKNLWKGYLSYIPKLYRWLLFLVFPLLIWIAYWLIQRTSTKENIMFVFIAIYSFVEVMADFFPFGAINSKKNRSFDFLNSSIRGKTFLKKVLITDGVRRLFSYLILMIGCQLIYSTQIATYGSEITTTAAGVIGYTLFSALIGFGLTTLILLVTRLTDVLAVSLLGGYAAAIILSGLFILLFSGALVIGWILIIGIAAIGFVAQYLLIMISEKRIKESCYDK